MLRQFTIADYTLFLKKVSNKMLFVVHGDMAAELIVGVNAEKENIGLTTWKNLPYRIIVNPE